MPHHGDGCQELDRARHFAGDEVRALLRRLGDLAPQDVELLKGGAQAAMSAASSAPGRRGTDGTHGCRRGHRRHLPTNQVPEHQAAHLRPAGDTGVHEARSPTVSAFEEPQQRRD